MNRKEKFNEMVAYDFSNLNLEQEGNDNCFAQECEDTCVCDCDCDGGCDYCDDEGACDECDNNTD